MNQLRNLDDKILYVKTNSSPSHCKLQDCQYHISKVKKEEDRIQPLTKPCRSIYFRTAKSNLSNSKSLKNKDFYKKSNFKVFSRNSSYAHARNNTTVQYKNLPNIHSQYFTNSPLSSQERENYSIKSRVSINLKNILRSHRRTGEERERVICQNTSDCYT